MDHERQLFQMACRSSTTTFRRDRATEGLWASEELLSKGYAFLERANQESDPCRVSLTGAGMPYSCRDRSGPRACKKIACHRLAVSLTAWSHAIWVIRLISRSKKSARACCEEFWAISEAKQE